MAFCPVSWRSEKQTLVITSLCEAEYIALYNASKEAIWLKMLYQNITGDANEHSTLLSLDNQGARDIAHNGFNDRSKHIDIKYHFVREPVECKKMVLK